jgi:hypothetical protein
MRSILLLLVSICVFPVFAANETKPVAVGNVPPPVLEPPRWVPIEKVGFDLCSNWSGSRQQLEGLAHGDPAIWRSFRAQAIWQLMHVYDGRYESKEETALIDDAFEIVKSGEPLDIDAGGWGMPFTMALADYCFYPLGAAPKSEWNNWWQKNRDKNRDQLAREAVDYWLSTYKENRRLSQIQMCTYIERITFWSFGEDFAIDPFVVWWKENREKSRNDWAVQAIAGAIKDLSKNDLAVIYSVMGMDAVAKIEGVEIKDWRDKIVNDEVSDADKAKLRDWWQANKQNWRYKPYGAHL